MLARIGTATDGVDRPGYRPVRRRRRRLPGRPARSGWARSSSLLGADRCVRSAMSPDGSMVAVTTSPCLVSPRAGHRRRTDGAEVAVVELGPRRATRRMGRVRARGRRHRSIGAVRLVQLDGTSQPVDARWPRCSTRSATSPCSGPTGATRVVELAAPDDALREFCDGGGPVSPDGRWSGRHGSAGRRACATGRRVLELDSGATSRLPVPTCRSVRRHRLGGRRDRALLTSRPRRRAGRATRASCGAR